MTINKMETFVFQYDGQIGVYSLEELEEGFWAVSCKLPMFKMIVGSERVNKADSFTDILLQVGAVNPELMEQMWQPYYASYFDALNRFRSIRK